MLRYDIPYRLLNAFAEEAATEDAIYYMGEALRRGVIDLDVFLKQVRSLSRKQFMLRALMHKCRQKAGLAGWETSVYRIVVILQLCAYIICFIMLSSFTQLYVLQVTNYQLQNCLI